MYIYIYVQYTHFLGKHSKTALFSRLVNYDEHFARRVSPFSHSLIEDGAIWDKWDTIVSQVGLVI